MTTLSKILIVTGVFLSIAVFILTCIQIKLKKESESWIESWRKCISIVAACLVLCASGAVINVLNLQVSVVGDNNNVSLNFPEGDIANAPGTMTLEEVPVGDYETVDSWIVGWADSNGGRDDYTLQQVRNTDTLDQTVVFNSISDGTIGHEFNFVGARVNTGESAQYYNANEIEAVENQTYIVRLFCHNNSRIAENIAENVRVQFKLSETKYVTDDGKYEAAVHGFITASNSDPEWYSDGVKFISDKPFHLEYICGTAEFSNNAIGNLQNGGYRLDDSIIGSWVMIGYDKMDGRIPACYQYSSVTTIKVLPVFE